MPFASDERALYQQVLQEWLQMAPPPIRLLAFQLGLTTQLASLPDETVRLIGDRICALADAIRACRARGDHAQTH